MGGCDDREAIRYMAEEDGLVQPEGRSRAAHVGSPVDQLPHGRRAHQRTVRAALRADRDHREEGSAQVKDLIEGAIFLTIGGWALWKLASALGHAFVLALQGGG